MQLWATGGTLIVALALCIPAIFVGLIIAEAYAMRYAH